jgi:hypothetical protein
MTTSSDVQLLSIDDLRLMREPEWLIEPFIHKGDVAVIYGPPASGKSFLALDWALTLAAGVPWLDRHPVACSPVLYMAGEGGPSMFKRIDAWMEAHEVEHIPTAYFHLKPLPLREEDAIEAVEQTFAAYDHQDGDYGLYPGMVVVDTLSQFFSGGDEVSPDMTQFVSNMRRIAQTTGAAVLIVHHTNVGGERERGHTSLRCNVEVMFKVEAQVKNYQIRGFTLVNDKQKDDPTAKPIQCSLNTTKNSLTIGWTNPKLSTVDVVQVNDVFLRNLLLAVETNESKKTEVALHLDLIEETGWARSTLHKRLDKLKKLKLVTGAGRGKCALTLLGRNTLSTGREIVED